jgi:hypothetical protein
MRQYAPRRSRQSVDLPEPGHRSSAPPEPLRRRPPRRALVPSLGGSSDVPAGARPIAVGIDPSLTGFAMCAINWPTGEIINEEVLKTKPTSTTRRYKEIEQWLAVRLRMLGPERIGMVCIEDFARERKQGREESGMLRLACLNAMWEVFGDTEDAYPTVVSIGTLKKFITGKGSHKKEVLMMYTLKKYGLEYSDNNLCDAHGLARISAALASGQQPDLAYERECLLAVDRRSTWEPPSPRR